MTPINIDEFKALIEKYESLTLEDLIETPLRELTGFGNIKDCKLCARVNSDCDICVYRLTNPLNAACMQGKNKESYDNIAMHAHRPFHAQQVYDAIQQRIVRMKQIIEQFNL